MPLRFVLGKSGSGKTDFCLTEALANTEKSIIIVPEQYSFTAEKLLAERSSVYGFGHVDVLSFKRLAHRLLSVSKGASLKRLGRSGKAILIQKILIDNIDKLTVLKKAAIESVTAIDLAKLFGEFKRYNISAEGFMEVAKELEIEKLSEISLIYSEYQKHIQNTYIDTDDDLQALSTVLSSSDFLIDTNIYIDSFEGFTPSELLCIGAMLNKAPRVTISLCLAPDSFGRTEFYPTQRTFQKLKKIAEDLSVKIEKPVVLSNENRDRADEIQFLMDNFFSYSSEGYDKKTENISIFESKNPYEEIHFVARNILKLCREKGYKFRDFAVTGRACDKYEKYIKTIFAEYGIDCYLDRNASLLSHPLSVFLLSTLEIIIKGYEHTQIFGLVKSGFLHINRENADILENYILATGVRGPVWKSPDNWDIGTKIYSESCDLDTGEEAVLQIVDKTRRLISEPIEALRQELIEGKTAREKCAALYKFIIEYKIKRRLEAFIRLFELSGNKIEASEYSGIYNDLMNALDDICVAFGDEKISIKDFYDVLKSGLGAYETGIIPATLDGVSVGNIDRIKGYKAKALFIIGVTDGVFPAAQKTDGLITDDDRAKIEELGISTAPRGTDKLLDENFLIYKAFSLAENHIYFSYPMSEMDGSPKRPSIIIERVKSVFPKIQFDSDVFGIPDSEKISSPSVTLGHVLTALRAGELTDELLAAYSWFCENDSEFTGRLQRSLNDKNKSLPLEKEVREKLIGKDLYTSVSRLERFSACPFSYFVQYTLGTKERKVLKMLPVDVGSFLHNFIDEFSKRLKAQGRSWKTVDEAYIDSEIEEISKAFYKRINKYVLQNSPAFSHLLYRLKRMLRLSLTMISSHIKIGKFEPLGYEISFGENDQIKPLELTLPGGATVKLTGKIDRADSFYSEVEKATFVRVIDYKSGSKDFNISDVFYGLNLQLSVYLTALCEDEGLEQPVKPAGILYFMLDDPITEGAYGFTPLDAENSHNKALKLKGLISNNENVVKYMDEGFEASSDYLPIRKSSGEIKGGCNDARFKILSDYIKKISFDISSRLLCGETDINPYLYKSKSPCVYCAYKTICQFDGCYSRELQSLDDEEVWRRMEEGVSDGN